MVGCKPTMARVCSADLTLATTWSARLYDSGGNQLDQLTGTAPTVTITGSNFATDTAYGDEEDLYGQGDTGITQSGADLSYAIITVGAKVTPLWCDTSDECRMVIQYCRGAKIPMTGHPWLCK